MRRLSGVALSVIVGMIGCSGAQPGSATLQGSIKNATGAAMPGILATLAGSQLSARTDAAGQFSLSGAPPGAATLRLSAPGVETSVSVPKLGKSQVVRLSVVIAADGKAALETEPETEISGNLDSVSAPDLVVAGHTIHTDAQTSIRIAGTQASLDALKVGERLEVEGALQADGSVLARKIEADLEHQPESEVELRGAIDTAKAPDFTVAGKTVHTAAATRITIDGRAAAFADLSVGERVEVKGSLQADGSVLASEVKAESVAAPGADATEIKGAIEAVAAPDLTVNGKTVHTNASTRIEVDGRDASFAALAAGQSAEVKGAAQADGSVLASRIEATSAQPPPPPPATSEVELRGKVESKSGSDLTVAGHVVHTGTLTVVDGHGAASLADLSVGATVEVRGALQADGSTLATRIHLED